MARILIVDDNEGVRQSLSIMLSVAGHDIVEALNGKEALSIWQGDQGIDIVITDVVMPEMDGIELAKSLREKKSDVKIIVMSGGGIKNSKEDTLSKASEFADATLSKPFRKDDIMTALDDLL